MNVDEFKKRFFDRSGYTAFYMAIADVFNITGKGSVVLGRIASGGLSTGEQVEIIGGNRPTRRVEVTGIEQYRKLVDYVTVGDVCGVLLRNMRKDELENGMYISTPGTFSIHKRFSATI